MKPLHKLDMALHDLADRDMRHPNGFISHAPMVVEALDHLGCAEAIPHWLAQAKPTLPPCPQPREVIDRSNAPKALGKIERYADWRAFFRAQIAAKRWQDVAGNWIPILTPGFSGGLVHGPIRVGHALRALQRKDTRERRRELADALASWAASYREPDMAVSEFTATQTPATAFADLPILPEARQKSAGAISTTLMQVGNLPYLADITASADLGGETDKKRNELAQIFAQVFLKRIDTTHRAIGFTHAITGLASTQWLADCVTRDEAHAQLQAAWITACMLHAARSNPAPVTDLPTTPPPAPGDLVQRAVQGGDEHGIKLTAACLDFYRQSGAGIFLHCAAHGLDLMNPD